MIRIKTNTCTDSLWALSADGMLWQINPTTGQAAPVLPLEKLTLTDRQMLRKLIVKRWNDKVGGQGDASSESNKIKEPCPTRYGFLNQLVTT